MELREYVRAVRRHWLLVLVAVALAVAGTAVLTQRAAPTYRSSTTLFVSGAEVDSSSDVKEQRLNSYVALFTGPRIAGTVIDELGLPLTVKEMQAKLSAEVEPGTVLVVVTATDASSRRAHEIVTVAASKLIALVQELESGRPGSGDAVTVTVAQNALTTREPRNLPRNIGFAVVLGLLVGAAGVAARETFHKTINTEQDLRRFADRDTVDVITPDHGGRRGLAGIGRNPARASAESFRRLRTRLTISRSAARRGLGGPGTRAGAQAGTGRAPLIPPANPAAGRLSLVLTSPNRREGTPAIAYGLATAMAETGVSVVLVDADLREEGAGASWAGTAAEGLSDVLAGRASLGEVLPEPGGGGLWVVPAGSPVADAGELLAAPALAQTVRTLAERFDVVLISAPPLLAVADAAVLSTLTTGVLLVVRAGRTRPEHVDAALGILRDVDAHVAGVVLNALPERALGGARREAGRRRTYPATSRRSLPDEGLSLVLPSTNGESGRHERDVREAPAEDGRREGQVPLG